MTGNRKNSQNQESFWARLEAHQKAISKLHMRDLFAEDSQRRQKYTISLEEIVIDFSKNRITDETLDLLLSLASAIDIKAKIHDLVSGGKVNISEQRPALHTALRSPPATPLLIDGVDINELIHTELNRIECFVQQLHQGQIKGAGGKPVKTVINIGIGGSDLGPRLVVEALNKYRIANINVMFVANLDPEDLHQALIHSDPETTLFIVASKSFTTLETLTNAKMARDWLVTNGCRDITQHFVAVSSNSNAALEFGITQDRIFHIQDWVGGRYSVWSAVGLPVAIAIGMAHFREFLAGGHSMDRHFQKSPLRENIPVILALLGIWYNNFFAAETCTVVPYDQRLRLLPEYLSQLVMESNGKSVTDQGKTLAVHTSPVIWGSIGTNAQHAFFQLLHQGTHLVPVDFLLPLQTALDRAQHKKLVANCLAQSKALMLGQTNEDEPHRHFPGNRPSTTILYQDLTPGTLGKLLALYEHKTYIEGRIWGINPFDQWGVELGKKLAGEIMDDLDEQGPLHPGHDPSTRFLIEQYRKATSN